MKRLLEFSQLNEATRSPRTLTKGWVNIVTGQIIEWTDMDQYHAMYMLKNLDKFRNIEYTELWGLLGDETLGSLETGELDRYEVEQYMNFVHSRGWFGYFVGKDLGGVYVDNLRQAQAAVKALEKKGYSYSSIFTRPSKFASDGFAISIANKRPFKEYFLQDAQMWKHFVRTGKILDTSKRSEIGNTMAMFRGESVELNESSTVYKGWIHLRKRKTIIWQTIAKPWHVQKIAQNPKQFGYTKQDLIDAVENGPQVLMVPVEDFVEQLAEGIRDVQWDIESMLFRDGWSKITIDLIDGVSDIYARDLKSGAKIVEILLKEVEALPLTTTYIWVGKDRITRSKREAKLEIPQDYEDFVQTGKAPDTRRKRTEIGRTMAMFRESVESEASFRAHWKKAPSSYDYKLSTMQGQNEYWNAYFKHFEDKYGELPSRIKKAIREAGFKSNPTITHKGERFNLRTGMDQLDLLYHVYSTMNESKLQEKTYAKSGLGAWMNQQSSGGGAGWDRYSTEGEKLGKCGDAKEGEPYSACLSRQKADKLGKKGIASFVRRKREAQKEAGRDDIGDGGKGQKPVYVKTGVTDKDPKKKGIQDDWSAKYKRSIDCDNPKGFSQRAHCQGRLKRENMHTFSEFSHLKEKIDPSQFPDPLPNQLMSLFKSKGLKDGSKRDDVVKTRQTNWEAGKLLPSQDAIYLGKSLGMAVGGVEGGDLGSIVSNDNRILDGHHRWAATVFNNPNAKVGGIEVDMPIKDLIPVLRALGDAFGNERRGNPGGTDINIYDAKPEDAVAAIETGKYMNPRFYDKEKSLQWLERIGGREELARRLKEIQRKTPPSGAPPRRGMPVIDAEKGEHISAAKALAGGELDVYPPYAKESVDLFERKNEPKNPSLWQKALAKAKSKFDVYPSAYANAWAAKWYKSQGGEWKAVQESEEEDKPLIKWFDEFERQLKKAGGNYDKVSPTDMLKLYYKGVNPRDAAKQLKESCGCGCGCEEDIESVTIIEEDGKEKEVDLNNPFRTPDGPKKFAVYVKNDKGNVVKVNFGDPNMSIQRDHEERLKSFRARHGCDKDPGPKWKAKYWSCKFWEKGSPITKLLRDKEVD